MGHINTSDRESANLKKAITSHSRKGNNTQSMIKNHTYPPKATPAGSDADGNIIGKRELEYINSQKNHSGFPPVGSLYSDFSFPPLQMKEPTTTSLMRRRCTFTSPGKGKLQRSEENHG